MITTLSGCRINRSLLHIIGIKKIILVAVFLHAVIALVFSQSTALNDIQNKFNNWRTQALQEKIFIHTDKNFYVAGEILWFKIYCVDGAFHKPLDVSKVAYVEILDNSNKPIWQGKIALDKAAGDGSIHLPLSINSGNYILRAYTNWMKNFGAAYFFHKTISIVNTLKSPLINTSDLSPLYNVEFFPEGGNLVAGIPGRVAFKFTVTNANTPHATGYVINKNNDTVANFQPLKFGLGSFSFTPQLNDNYKAFIRFSNGKTITKELPHVYNNGYAMRLHKTGPGKIQVIVNAKLSENKSDEEVFLFVHTRNALKVLKSAVLKNGNTDFIINESELGEGISQFTVFNGNRQPVCERLYFKRPSRNLHIEAKTDSGNYAVRRKVNVSIATKNNSGAAVPANMSMAVYRLDSLQAIDEHYMQHYFWLSSDLTGSIESPAWYFLNDSDTVAQATDHLMMTHGWRRFKWQDVLNNTQSSLRFMPEFNGHLVTGNVTNINTGKLAPNVVAYLSVPGAHTKFYVAKSDSIGRLQFEARQYYGAGEINVQPNTHIDSIYKIDILSPFFEEYVEAKQGGFRLSKNYERLLNDRSIAMQAQNIYWEDSIKKFTITSVDTMPFYGKWGHRYLLDDYTRFTTIEEVLREYVTDVNVRKRNEKFQMLALDEPNHLYFDEEPVALLDGLPAFETNKVFSYDPLKVRQVEVVARPYFFGPSLFKGIVNFTTYNGDYENFQTDPKAILIDYEGLQLQREFYAPTYETPQQTASRVPDFRNLLLWKPDILTGEKETQINFYTSDQKGVYIIAIQGINAAGYCDTKFISFQVN